MTTLTTATTTIRLPRVSENHDVIDTFAAFHEAMRDVAAWIPTIVDEHGNASPRDARWLRAFLTGPLQWHFDDEDNVVVPWLTMRRSAWLNASLARTAARHAEILEHAHELVAVLAPACAGERIPRVRFLNAARRFADAVECDLRYEDDFILPSSRLFLDASERAAIVKAIAVADEKRPWSDVAVAGDAPTIHRVHAVRAKTASGLDVIRSFAACPRRRSVNADACSGCPHLVAKDVDGDGHGLVACAIDELPAPARAARAEGGERMKAEETANSVRVGDVMTRDVVCVERDVTLTEAARVLATSCVSGLPVVDGRGGVVGVLSQSDLIDWVAKGASFTDRTVADAMMHAPIVVRESDTVEDAARLLLVEGIHRLPVVNGDRVIVGIVSTLDLLRACTDAPARA